MKRRIFFAIILLASLQGMAQQVSVSNKIMHNAATPDKYDQYIFPPFFLNLSCGPYQVNYGGGYHSSFNTSMFLSKMKKGENSTFGDYTYLHYWVDHKFEEAPRGYAQFFSNDTTLQIGGAAFFTYVTTKPDSSHMNSTVGDSVVVMDEEFNIIYAKELNDTLCGTGYYTGVAYNEGGDGHQYEVIFDSAITVTGGYWIGYIYSEKNVILYEPYPEVDWFGYKMDLYFCLSITNNATIDFKLYDKEIGLYNRDIGWNTYTRYKTHYGAPNYYKYLYIEFSQYTDLYSNFPAHTTDLCFFVIPESAIIDSIDRPWLFAQDTTITDSTDTNFLSQIDLERMIAVQPNPTKDEVVISCPEPLREVAILNPMGQVLYRENYNQKRITLDLSSYPQGVYILKIQTPSGGDIRRKIVKQ